MYLLEKTQACPEDCAAFEQVWCWSENINGTMFKAITVIPVLKGRIPKSDTIKISDYSLTNAAASNLDVLLLLLF